MSWHNRILYYGSYLAQAMLLAVIWEKGSATLAFMGLAAASLAFARGMYEGSQP